MAEESLSTDYLKHMEDFTNSISNTKYIIEVTKFCGYSEFIFVFKNSSLLDLYKHVSYQFSCNDIKGLYIRNEETKSKQRIPVTEQTTMRQFIMQILNSNDEFKDMMKPVYPLPSPVVYRVYFDDGHCSCHSNNKNNNNDCC